MALLALGCRPGQAHREAIDGPAHHTGAAEHKPPVPQCSTLTSCPRTAPDPLLSVPFSLYSAFPSSPTNQSLPKSLCAPSPHNTPFRHCGCGCWQPARSQVGPREVKRAENAGFWAEYCTHPRNRHRPQGSPVQLYPQLSGLTPSHIPKWSGTGCRGRSSPPPPASPRARPEGLRVTPSG